MTPDPLAAELADHLAETFPHLDVAAILRKGSAVLPATELRELLAATADEITTQRNHQ